MKIKTIIASAALLAAFSVAAKAAIVSATNGDLVLGFKTTASANNLEVDIGNFSAYTNLNGATFTVSQLSLLDIASLDAGWQTNTTVLWGIGGGKTNTTAPFSSFMTKNATAPGLSTLPLVSTASATSNVIGAFGNVLNGAQGLDGSTSTANSASSALINASLQNSWTSQEGNNAAAFGSSISVPQFEQNTNVAAGTKFADLYEMDSSTISPKPKGTLLGTFALSSTGLTFTSFAAVPEPSTYAVLLGAATLGFVMLRRRKQVGA